MIDTPDLRRIGCALVAAVLCSALFCTSASARVRSDDSTGFAVSPLRIDIDKQAGKTTSTYPVTIRNTNPKDAVFTLSKEDFEGDKDDADQTPRLLGGKFESKISGYDWLTDFPSAVTVPAGGSRTINVKVVIPPGESGGHYTALIVSGPETSIGDAKVRSRVAVLFMMDAGGKPPPEIVINEIIETTDGGTDYVEIPVTNTGDTDIQPEGTITYTDPVTGKVITEVPVDCPTILPDSRGTCRADLTPEEAAKLPGATFGAKGSVSLVDGDGKRIRAEIPTEWAGSWAGLLLPLVGLALFVLYFVFLRRRRRAVDDDLEIAL